MPFVVFPGSIPPPPTTDTGADGVLTGTLRPDGAGVLLSADFSALAQPVTAIRFVRAPDIAVRSGTDALAAGKKALAFDHEAPIGVPSTWRAFPVFSDGTLGASSDPVTLTAPTIPKTQVWVKSVTDPTKSVRATVVGPLGDITYPARAEYQSVQGSPYPVSAWDVWQSATLEMVFDVVDADARKALQACLTSGVLLLQANPGIDFDDMYVQAGDVTRIRYETTAGVNDTGQQLRAGLTEVARPSPVGAPLFIPGYSWGDVAASYSNWNHVAAVVPNWAALATGDPEA